MPKLLFCPKSLRKTSILSKLSKVNFLGEEKKFTIEELSKYDGKNGNPAYIACNGKVYDVTDSGLWMGGDHLGAHQAGKDLSMELDIAPHGPENLDRVKLVGVLG
jgi:predicted heme/steroid binding protein